MGGGPRTPPDLSDLEHVSSRSHDSLVEVTVGTAHFAVNESTTPQYGSAPPTPAEGASPSGTASFAMDPLAGTSSEEKTLPLPPVSAGEDGQEEQLAELLWSKSAVYLAPSSSARDSIPGFLSIVRVREGGEEKEKEKEGADRWNYLLSWVPESLAEGLKDVEAYVLVELSSQNERDVLVHLAPSLPSSTFGTHAFSYPLTSLYSLQVTPPTLTSWTGSVVVSLFGGESLPPLSFHDDESRSTLVDRNARSASSPNVSRRERSSSLAPGWGGEALLQQLRLHALLVRSQLDPSVYLVNPSRLDLDAHVHGGAAAYGAHEDDPVPDEAMRAVRGRTGEGERGEHARDREEQRRRMQQQQGGRTSILHHSSPVAGRPKGRKQEEEYPDDLDTAGHGNGAQQGGGMDALTFSVLSGFSRITRGARQLSREAASTVLSHPLAKPLAKHVPKPIAQFALADGEVSRLADKAGVGTYDSARVYLAKWAKIVAEEGERARRAEYGVEDGSFLEEELGLGDSTGVFEVLSKTYRLDEKPRSTRAPKTPIQLEEWHAWMDAKDGRLLLSEAEARRRIFQRGLADDDTRREVWPFLLKVYGWDSTSEERKKVAELKSAEYERIKRSWMQDEASQATERFQEEDHRVEIDARRTDRLHPLFASDVPLEDAGGAHPPTNGHVTAMHHVLMTFVFAPEYAAEGEKAKPAIPAASEEDEEGGVRNYVQGMSDLFSPLYVVLDGEQWLAYACFETVMERQKDNFRADQSGMKRQLSGLQGLIRVMDRGLYRHLEETGSLNLFFCFRWILTSFKRELTFDQTVLLWENLFTDHLGTHFHLFFALAILEAHRDVMVRYLREFDEILKYTNQLSGSLNLTTLLSDAEVLYYTFDAIVSASTPAPSAAVGEEGLRQRKPASAAAESSRVGTFPPTAEDAEERRRERVRERTRREIEELRELLK
ncbi:hypothetical protein JCM10213_006652 [Rhodosporidiobolus nylandii]